MKAQATEYEQFQDIERYSACSYHCTHMRRPSSKKVETKQNLAMWGRVVLEWERALSTASSRDIVV